ncbi:QRFP-like peptide receptor [Oculina patagonica]
MSTMLNATMHGTQPSSCYNPSAARIGTIFAYCLIFVVSLAGNIFIGIIVYKTKTMRRPINFLIVNMAMSDLFYPIFLIPKKLTELYVDSWLISGPLGQALCKLIFFLPEVSVAVSIQSLVLIAVDRFGAVVFPLRPPVINSKLCRFLILATWIVAMAIFSPYLFAAKLAKDPGGLTCALQWNEVFGESSSYKNYILAMLVVLVYNPLVLIAMLYIIIYSKLKSQTIPGEQSANAGQQRVKRKRNVLKMAIAIVVGFAVC